MQISGSEGAKVTSVVEFTVETNGTIRKSINKLASK